MVELPQYQPQQMLMPGAPFALPSLTGAPMMLPSLAAGAPMLPSMNPGMDDDVAARYGQALIQQNAAQLQEMMVLSGDYTATMRNNLQELNTIGSNLSQINTLLLGAVQGLQQTGTTLQSGVGGGGGGGGGGSTRMAPTGLSEGGTGTPAADEAPDTATLSQRFTEGRSIVQNRQNVLSVTRGMAGRASAALQAETGTWDTTPDENGNIRYYPPNPAIDDQGQPIPSKFAPATEENIATATKDGQRMRRASGLLSRYSAGESLLGGEGGLLGGLGAGALKAAGPIGLAVGVADFGFKQFTNQTEAGTQYRAAYGEDAGRFAFSQRAGADLAGLGGYFTGVGFGRSKQNYEAAAQQGLTGDRLGEASGFMNDMYTKLGLDTQTSVQAVQIAAQNTTITLGSLKDNILDVSKAAVDAGKNSEVAVQSFLNVTQQVQQGVTNTAAAPVLAGQLSTAMSQNLATSLNTPGMASQFAGLITQQNIGMVAARTGQDFRSLSQQVATGTGGAPQAIVGQTLTFAVQDICKAAGTDSATLKAYINKAYPGVTNLAPNMQMEVLSQFPNLTPQIITGIFGTYGMQVNPGDATTLFFNTLLSDITQFGTAGSDSSGAKSPSAAQVQGGSSQILGDSGFLSGEGMSALGIDMQPGATAAGGRAGASAMAAMQSKLNSGPYSEYTDYAKSSGNRDLAVEALIKNASSVTSFAGKDNLDDVQFTMSDGSSKSLSEILKDPSLLSQFDQGTPYVKGKNPNDVKSVGDITDYSASGSSAAATPGGTSPLGGGYTISLTPEAQRLFNLSGPSAAQSQGVPPAGNVNPFSYAK